MRQAAYLLASTDTKVLDVAAACGFASLGHFYHVFGMHHGCSPAEYRRRQPPGPLDTIPARVCTQRRAAPDL
jgi:AraC-like DNA-binding protein